MRVQLAQQAQEILGTSDLVIITERVDDVALLIGQMVKMGLPEVLDRHIPRHWSQRGLSWGWTAVIWLAYTPTATSIFDLRTAPRYAPPAYPMDHQEAPYVTSLSDRR